MQLFRLSPPWNKAGDNPYPWVDSADHLFDPEGIHKVQPLLEAWNAPRLFTSISAPRVDAYCCPGGFYLFSSQAREVLAQAFGSAVEWLPAEIRGIGDFTILHPLRSCALGPDAKYKLNEVSRNISQIEVYDFVEPEIADMTVFYTAQPAKSAAGMAGYCCRDVICTDLPSLIWQQARLRGVRFDPVATATTAGAKPR